MDFLEFEWNCIFPFWISQIQTSGFSWVWMELHFPFWIIQQPKFSQWFLSLKQRMPVNLHLESLKPKWVVIVSLKSLNCRIFPFKSLKVQSLISQIYEGFKFFSLNTKTAVNCIWKSSDLKPQINETFSLNKIAVNCIGNLISNPKSMEFLVWTEIIAVNCIGNHLSNPKSMNFLIWAEIIAVNNNIFTSQN